MPTDEVGTTDAESAKLKRYASVVDIAGKISNRLEKYILEAWEAIKAKDGKSGENSRKWKAAA